MTWKISGSTWKCFAKQNGKDKETVCSACMYVNVSMYVSAKLEYI